MIIEILQRATMTRGYNNCFVCKGAVGTTRGLVVFAGGGRWGGLQLQFNRSSPSFHLPFFQNESKCKTFVTNMSLICIRMNL